MRILLAAFLIFPLVSLAKSPIAEPDAVRVTLVQETKENDKTVMTLLVGKEIKTQINQEITRKALLLGVKISSSETFKGYHDEIKYTIDPAVDQEKETKELVEFIRQID